MSLSSAIPHQVLCLSKTNKCSLFSLCDNFRIQSSLRLIWILQLPCLPHHYCLHKLCSCLWSFSSSSYCYYRVYTYDYLPYVQVWCTGRLKCSHGDAAGAVVGHGTAVAAQEILLRLLSLAIFVSVSKRGSLDHLGSISSIFC
ncbi:hypothetical protein BDA96_10G114900 [Sorghum bicolor]|uniref:Uncharacterized protein n=1 Tax=Sorghum bicolor TaxID=4558 RepID=A0A921TZZ6_SORBI|nr:hypothetical protein SORBI_3010G094100 [Sorghum bicolor]KAG0513582.1 hypothetical protein BDA96_10G114900 [Sorghum bicolor]